jgi:alpha-galactosidase
MGYNTWYDLADKLNEDVLKQTADKMVSLGLVQLGYTYFNLDDDWAAGRNPDGSVYADPAKFPSKTLKPLADYVHERGMLFGTYTDRGTSTCGGKPGSQGYEKIDAQVYASWGIDYVKEDSCYATQDHDQAFAEYALMRDSLNATGRSIFFDLCGWYPWYAPKGATLGNSWRIGPDDTTWPDVLTNIDLNSQLSAYAGPGGWNDPCYLIAESLWQDDLLTELQSRAQFSIWSVMAAPLQISANIRNMSSYNIETYTNSEVIAVDQDPLCRQGIRLAGNNLGYKYPTLDGSVGREVPSASGVPNATNVWGRPLYNGDWAIVFLNSATADVDITCDSDCLKQTAVFQQNVVVRDLWAHQDVLNVMNITSLTAKAVKAAGGSAMYRLSVAS